MRGRVVSVGAVLAVVAGLLQFASPVAVAAGGGDMHGTPRNAVIYDKPLAVR